MLNRYSACKFPSADLASLLLTVGANPNARDDDGNTPLHLAATSPCDPVLTSVLLEHGAHLDLTNNDGDTFETLLQQPIHTVVNSVRHKTLACLAARTVRAHVRREHYSAHLPSTLIPFVDAH